jgi:NAD(P)-dependent dehydrogenase (short-subunit alcohol dehydrogenase family)
MATGKVALVTGANKGLGKEVVRQLANLGVTVLLGSRDQSRGREAVNELLGGELPVSCVEIDVTNPQSVSAVADLIRREHGHLDILINNAGIYIPCPAFEITAKEMRLTFETNVFAVVTVTHAMLPLLRRAPAARVVNVASTTASQALTADPKTMFGLENNTLAYASSKSAVTMLTLQYANAMRRDPAYAHIKVNAATPGYIATDLNNHTGTRTVAQGAQIVVKLATLPDNGPSGGFFNDSGPVPW